MTLASIVEKETGVAGGAAAVAAVFVNRLRRGMQLQTDPTVIYGITQGRAPLGRPLCARRAATRHALQHLRDRRPAAGADRQSRPRRARRPCCEPGRRATSSTSSPTAPAATPSPRPSRSTTATSRALARARAPARPRPGPARGGRRPAEQPAAPPPPRRPQQRRQLARPASQSSAPLVAARPLGSAHFRAALRAIHASARAAATRRRAPPDRATAGRRCARGWRASRAHDDRGGALGAASGTASGSG